MRGGTINQAEERGGSYIYHLVYTKVLREGLELDSFRHAHMPPPESQTMGSKLKQHPSTPCSEEEEERVTIEDGWRWQSQQRHGVRVHCVALVDKTRINRG